MKWPKHSAVARPVSTSQFAQGELHTLKLGRLTRIPLSVVNEFIGRKLHGDALFPCEDKHPVDR